MITRIRLCYSHAAKVKGPSEIPFSPGLNVLIGPNGSGKSTVLRALHACDRCKKEMSGGTSIQYFDSETMNPHAPATPPSTMRGMILRTRGVFSSHGEIMKAALVSIPVREGDTLLVDEPESGQDLAGVQRIRQGFDAICERGGQVIAASHHPVLLEGGNIIELVSGYAEHIRTELCRSLCKPAGTADEERDPPARSE